MGYTLFLLAALTLDNCTFTLGSVDNVEDPGTSTVSHLASTDLVCVAGWSYSATPTDTSKTYSCNDGVLSPSTISSCSGIM